VSPVQAGPLRLGSQPTAYKMTQTQQNRSATQHGCPKAMEVFLAIQADATAGPAIKGLAVMN
jgi:hypothetical protein